MYTKPQANYVFTLKRKADSVFEQLTGRPVKVARVELFEDVSIRIKKTTKGFQVEIDEPSQDVSSPASYSSYSSNSSDSSHSSSSNEMATVNRPWSDCSEDSEEEAAREMRNSVYAGASNADERINAEQFLCYAHRNSSASTSCGPVNSTHSNGIATCNGCNSLTCEDCRPFNLNLQLDQTFGPRLPPPLSPQVRNYSDNSSEDNEDSDGSESYRRWAEKQKNTKVDSVVSEESEAEFEDTTWVKSPVYNAEEKQCESSEESDDAATHVMHTPKAVPYTTHCRHCPTVHCAQCLTKNKFADHYGCCECHDAFAKVDLQRLYEDGHIANCTNLWHTLSGKYAIIVANDKLRSFVRIRAYNGEAYDCLCEWLVALGTKTSEDPMQFFEFEDDKGWHNVKTFIHQNYSQKQTL